MNTPPVKSPQRIINTWLAFLVVSGIIGTIGSFIVTFRDRLSAVRLSQRALNAVTAAEDSGIKLPPGPPGQKLVQVRSGIYIERIFDLSLKDTRWSADFFIWFDWQGGEINPGETFQVVDGFIESREKVQEVVEGEHHYVMYRVVATINRYFDVSRFPLDDHLLLLGIVDPTAQFYQLEFVADTKDSAVNQRVRVPGYNIMRTAVLSMPYSFRTNRGDLTIPGDAKAIYSQLMMGIWLNRMDAGFLLKLFQGLYAAVAIAIVGLFSRPTADPRFGLAIGAFFAAVANTYITASLLPNVGIMTLSDVINGLGMATIFLILVHSTISLYIFDRLGLEEESRRMDKIAALIFSVGYLAMNLGILLGARVSF